MNILQKYNLSNYEMKTVRLGFHCLSKKHMSLRKDYCKDNGFDLFRMKCCDINIIKNDQNSKEVKIKNNIVQFKIENPNIITVEKKDGWGIFGFYHSKTLIKKEKRNLNLYEIEKIKKLMKEKLENYLLNN